MAQNGEVRNAQANNDENEEEGWFSKWYVWVLLIVAIALGLGGRHLYIQYQEEKAIAAQVAADKKAADDKIIADRRAAAAKKAAEKKAAEDKLAAERAAAKKAAEEHAAMLSRLAKYTVKRGDTLSQRFGYKKGAEVCAFNLAEEVLTDCDTLKVGVGLYVPDGIKAKVKLLPAGQPSVQNVFYWKNPDASPLINAWHANATQEKAMTKIGLTKVEIAELHKKVKADYTKKFKPGDRMANIALLSIYSTAVVQKNVKVRFPQGVEASAEVYKLSTGKEVAVFDDSWDIGVLSLKPR